MSKKHHPAHVIMSGRPRILREPPHAMAHVFLRGDHSGRRHLRRVNHPDHLPGRVNHGTMPLAYWWWIGFRRNAADWARWRHYNGLDGRINGFRVPRHELRRAAMLHAWHNHRENVSEQHMFDCKPRVAEFHLFGLRYWAVSTIGVLSRARRPEPPHFWRRPRSSVPSEEARAAAQAHEEEFLAEIRALAEEQAAG